MNLHKDIFLMNGFKVVCAADERPDDPNVNQNEFLIKSLPHSKNTVFNVDDFLELVQIVGEHIDYSQDDLSTTGFRVGVTDRS